MLDYIARGVLENDPGITDEDAAEKVYELAKCWMGDDGDCRAQCLKNVKSARKEIANAPRKLAAARKRLRERGLPKWRRRVAEAEERGSFDEEARWAAGLSKHCMLGERMEVTGECGDLYAALTPEADRVRHGLYDAVRDNRVAEVKEMLRDVETMPRIWPEGGGNPAPAFRIFTVPGRRQVGGSRPGTNP